MAPDRFAIGVDVGGTNMRAARISPSGDILRKSTVGGSRDPSRALELIEMLVRDMGGAEAVAVGIGIPGRVNGRTGEVLSGGFLNLAGVDLHAHLGQAFGCAVKVANDCSMALIGETRCGAAKGLANVAMLTIGTGIGGAVMENGRLLTGRRCAGQLGHLIVRSDGHPCPCGQRGCVETESSGTSLRRHLDEAGYGADIRFEDVSSQARAGDQRARSVMRAWAGPLRSAIRTLSAAVDPDVVLLGGGMGHAALEAMAYLPDNPSWYDVDVRGAMLGDDAGVIGAGLAAFDLVDEAQASRPAGGKRLVMVNGVPASGKSSLARRLGEATGWPVVGLDTIKNPFLELIEGVDRPFNRILGRASYKSIFSIIRDAAPGSTFIVDAWFGFQPRDVLDEHVAMAGITGIVELWCHAPPEAIGERYRLRLADRLPGHPGEAYVPELMDLAARARPCGFAPTLDIDTTRAVDIDATTQWVTRNLTRGRWKAVPADTESRTV